MSEFLNINVQVDWQMGGEVVIDECFALSSDDPLFSAAETLREFADQLDRLSAHGIRGPKAVAS